MVVVPYSSSCQVIFFSTSACGIITAASLLEKIVCLDVVTAAFPPEKQVIPDRLQRKKPVRLAGVSDSCRSYGAEKPLFICLHPVSTTARIMQKNAGESVFPNNQCKIKSF
jgi:hypothetical protein